MDIFLKMFSFLHTIIILKNTYTNEIFKKIINYKCCIELKLLHLSNSYETPYLHICMCNSSNKRILTFF